MARMITTRPFEEGDLAGVTRFVQQCGLDTSEAYLREHLLRSPLGTAGTCFPAGIVVFADTRCVAFQGLVFRKIYFKQTEKWGYEGTVLAMTKDYAGFVVGEFFRQIMHPRGQAIYYSNTCMPQTVKLLKVAGMKNPGPVSCERIRFFVVRWGEMLNALCHQRGIRIPPAVRRVGDALGRIVNLFFCRSCRSKSITERIVQIGDDRFKRFWEDYLALNDGVVVSRSPDELRWLFGKGLSSGTYVMMARVVEDRIVGYIVLKRHGANHGTRWMVSDWIALNNDRAVLHDLLLDARRFASSSGAFCLELTGFPMKAQSVIKACLPFSRKAICNTFLFRLFDDSLREALIGNPDKGWFWGPMDGDRCVN